MHHGREARNKICMVGGKAHPAVTREGQVNDGAEVSKETPAAAGKH